MRLVTVRTPDDTRAGRVDGDTVVRLDAAEVVRTTIEGLGELVNDCVKGVEG